MGLDMYLEGRLYQQRSPSYWEKPETDEHRHGKRVKEITVELGYWRKHPDLHGWIVKNTADGTDDCEDISLDRDDLLKLKAAIENDALAHGTKGFFFGNSYQPGEKDEQGRDVYAEQKKEDLEIVQGALDWLDHMEMKDLLHPNGGKWWALVNYRASW